MLPLKHRCAAKATGLQHSQKSLVALTVTFSCSQELCHKGGIGGEEVVKVARGEAKASECKPLFVVGQVVEDEL